MAEPLVVAVANRKGGVAKTASTLALAEAARFDGRIDRPRSELHLDRDIGAGDLDAAGSKGSAARRPGSDRDLSLAARLTGAGAQWGGVIVCVSDPLLSNREYDLTAPTGEERLRRSIKLDAGEVDLVIIDLPAAERRVVANWSPPTATSWLILRSPCHARRDLVRVPAPAAATDARPVTRPRWPTPTRTTFPASWAGGVPTPARSTRARPSLNHQPTGRSDLMPPRTRQKKAPAPVVGARRTDVLDPKPAAAVPTAPAAGRRRRKIGAAQAAAPIKKTTSKAEGTSHTDVDPPTVPKRAARKVQRSFYVDVDVLEDARAAVTYLGAYVPEAGVQSLADLVNPGLAAMVKQLQDTYNAGKPFRRVSHMQAGRPRR